MSVNLEQFGVSYFYISLQDVLSFTSSKVDLYLVILSEFFVLEMYLLFSRKVTREIGCRELVN